MKRMFYSLIAVALCAPLAAQAFEGWVVADISLQAGPDPAYPSITELSAGTPVSIQGCIDGWTWCDVAVGYDRGWVPGTFLEEDYGGRRVVVVDYGPQIAIPVVSFSLGLYWDRHYHDRPFYTQREVWVAKAIRPSPPPHPAATAVARTAAPSGSQQSKTIQQSQTAATQQRSTATQQPRPKMTARATAPQRPESVPLPKAQTRASPSAPTTQPGKPEVAEQTATVAKAKPRAGEPKPKDELKKAKPKEDRHDQSGGDGEH